MDPEILKQLREPVKGFLTLDEEPDLKLSIRLYIDLGGA